MATTGKPGASGVVAPLRLKGRRALPGALLSDDGFLTAAAWVGAIGVCVLCFVFAAIEAAGPSAISQKLSAATGGPAWLAGPFQGLIGLPSPNAVNTIANVGLPVMFTFYVLAVVGSRQLTPKLAFGLVVLAQLILVLGPPTVLTDEFIYIQEGRMWVVQHLNPYLGVINDVPHGGLLYGLTAWKNIQDTYGQLFELLMAPISSLPLAAADWTTRGMMLASSLLTVWLCGRCAAEVRASASRAMVLLGLNPVIVFYTVGGAHNDCLAVAPIAGALLLNLRARRPDAERPAATGLAWIDTHWNRSELLCFSAGLLIMLGVGLKTSVAICAPVLVAAAVRRTPVIFGVALGGIVLWIVTAVCFDGYLPDITQQGAFINGTSFGSVLGVLLGLGGETMRLRTLLEAVAVLMVGWSAVTAWRRPQTLGDGATWSAIALVVAVGWLEPWYALLFLVTVSATRTRVVILAASTLSLLILLANLPDGQWLRGFDGSVLNMLHARVYIPFAN